MVHSIHLVELVSQISTKSTKWLRGEFLMYAAYLGYGFILFSIGFTGAYLIAVFKKGANIAT